MPRFQIFLLFFIMLQFYSAGVNAFFREDYKMALICISAVGAYALILKYYPLEYFHQDKNKDKQKGEV